MKNESRIVTTHTGSLPRPDDLEAIILAREAGGPVDAELLEATIRSGLERMVHSQIAAGVDWINDGEASKASYMGYTVDRLSGFEPMHGREANWDELEADYPGLGERLRDKTEAAFAAVRFPELCTGPIRYIGHDAVQRDIDNLTRAANGVDVEGLFMSALSPGMLFDRTNEHYPNDEDYHMAIADALREEYEAINRAGILLQLDCPDLTGAARTGGHAELELRVEAINRATEDIPAEMVRVHLCWGNIEMPHDRDLEFVEFAEFLLERLKPAGLSFEAANPRHGHEWKIFEDLKLPDGKYLIPGVIDVKTNFVEHPELVAQRIVQYANLVGRDNVVAGTDCGFGTLIGMHNVLPAVAWRKLRSMREGAEIASRQLW